MLSYQQKKSLGKTFSISLNFVNIWYHKCLVRRHVNSCRISGKVDSDKLDCELFLGYIPITCAASYNFQPQTSLADKYKSLPVHTKTNLSSTDSSFIPLMLEYELGELLTQSCYTTVEDYLGRWLSKCIQENLVFFWTFSALFINKSSQTTLKDRLSTTSNFPLQPIAVWLYRENFTACFCAFATNALVVWPTPIQLFSTNATMPKVCLWKPCALYPAVGGCSQRSL